MFQAARRAAVQSARAAVAVRTMQARAEPQRAWAARTMEETRTAVARSRIALRDVRHIG